MHIRLLKCVRDKEMWNGKLGTVLSAVDVFERISEVCAAYGKIVETSDQMRNEHDPRRRHLPQNFLQPQFVSQWQPTNPSQDFTMFLCYDIRFHFKDLEAQRLVKGQGWQIII